VLVICWLPSAVEIGSTVVVELHLPDATVLRLQAQVVASWSVEPGGLAPGADRCPHD